MGEKGQSKVSDYLVAEVAPTRGVGTTRRWADPQQQHSRDTLGGRGQWVSRPLVGKRGGCVCPPPETKAQAWDAERQVLSTKKEKHAAAATWPEFLHSHIGLCSSWIWSSSSFTLSFAFQKNDPKLAWLFKMLRNSPGHTSAVFASALALFLIWLPRKAAVTLPTPCLWEKRNGKCEEISSPNPSGSPLHATGENHSTVNHTGKKRRGVAIIILNWRGW